MARKKVREYDSKRLPRENLRRLAGINLQILSAQDRTGTIGASVHKKVISDENLGNGISVGSVIVLREVAVFRTSRTACYLNVTQQNVIKTKAESNKGRSCSRCSESG